ncbi:DUF3291 domain-containing protein [Vampirovibrio sp.]|uniref:DUF3291 domain-containing protein n=1 Tax=Vampirovibrio sp. TaxID=2717857 RepID=UPI003593BE4C
MTIPQYHLCHLNIGPANAPLSAPEMSGFVENLERINELAYSSPGFVWHLKIDINNPADLALYGVPGLLFNLSVWESVEALKEYTYKGAHAQMMQRRREWFGSMNTPNYVLWWIPAGSLPTLEEAKLRLAHRETYGPSLVGFDFKHPFEPGYITLGTVGSTNHDGSALSPASQG